MTLSGREEELKLVFALKGATQATVMSAARAEVIMQPKMGILGPRDCFQLIVDLMQALGMEPTFIDDGKVIKSKSMLKRIERRRNFGRLESSHLSFQYGVVASYDHCFLSIQEKIPGVIQDWTHWIRPFLNVDGFVQSWVSDVEYNYWQNAKDITQYEAAGRDFSHLVLKLNGLPPPLQRWEIDTSHNPGRSTLRQGYVEAIGRVMWVSELFWKRLGHSRADYLKSIPGVQTIQLEGEILEIRGGEKDFFSEQTTSTQNELRRLLYGDPPTST